MRGEAVAARNMGGGDNQFLLYETRYVCFKDTLNAQETNAHARCFH
jgi:hypothetical protein